MRKALSLTATHPRKLPTNTPASFSAKYLVCHSGLDFAPSKTMPKWPRGVGWRGPWPKTTHHLFMPWILVLQGLLLFSSQCIGATTLLPLPHQIHITEAQHNTDASMKNTSAELEEVISASHTIPSATPLIISSIASSDDAVTSESFPPSSNESEITKNVQPTMPPATTESTTKLSSHISQISPTTGVGVSSNSSTDILTSDDDSSTEATITDTTESANADHITETVTIFTTIQDEKSLETSLSNGDDQYSANETLNSEKNGSTLLRRYGEMNVIDETYQTDSSGNETQDSIEEISTNGPTPLPPSRQRMGDIMLGDSPVSSNRQERSFINATKFPEQRTQVEATPIADALQTILNESLLPTEQIVLNNQLATTIASIAKEQESDDPSDGGETSGEATTVVETSSEVVTVVENDDDDTNNEENKTASSNHLYLTLIDTVPTNASADEPNTAESDPELRNTSIVILTKNITGIGIKTTVSVSLNVSHMPNMTGDDNSILLHPLDIRRYLQRKNLNRNTSTDTPSENQLAETELFTTDSNSTVDGQKLSLKEASINVTGDVSTKSVTGLSESQGANVSNVSLSDEALSLGNISISDDSEMTINETSTIIVKSTTVTTTPSTTTTSQRRFIFPKKPSRKPTTTTTTTTTRKPKIIRTTTRRRPSSTTPSPTTTSSTTPSPPPTTQTPSTTTFFLNATLFSFTPFTGSTTSTPFVPEPVIKVAGVMKITHGIKWMPQLSDRNTPEYKKLAAEVVLMLEHLYRHTQLANRIKKIEIDGFSEGSVIVDYILYLREEDDMPEPQNLSSVFNSRLTSDNTYGPFRLDPHSTEFEIVGIWRPNATSSKPNDENQNSIELLFDEEIGINSSNLTTASGFRIYEYEAENKNESHISAANQTIFRILLIPIVAIWRPQATPTPVSEPPIPQWAIAVIVIGSASLIFIILFGAVTVYGRHHAYRKYGAKLQEEDAERAAAYKDWEAKVAAAYENLAADGVYDMDEVAENNRKNSVISSGKRTPKDSAYDSWRTDWSAHPGKKIRQSIDTSF